MDPRVSTLESDVAAVRANVETIHSNYATNIALVEAEARLRLEIVSSKNELDHKMDQFVAALRLEIVSSKNELDRKIDRVAAEQRLEFQRIASDMRNWLLATVIGLSVGFGGLFLGVARMLKP